MQNYQAKCGEIDLIMQDPTSDTVIFVEVRFRTSVQMGSAIETIGPSKQKKLSRTALHFLQKQGWTNRYPCRFDVMGIHLDQTKPQFHWIPNAF